MSCVMLLLHFYYLSMLTFCWNWLRNHLKKAKFSWGGMPPDPPSKCVLCTLLMASTLFICFLRPWELLGAARKLVGHYKHSNLSFQTLKQMQAQLGVPQHSLIQDEPTRWNSSFYMLQRLIEQVLNVHAQSNYVLSSGIWLKNYIFSNHLRKQLVKLVVSILLLQWSSL